MALTDRDTKEFAERSTPKALGFHIRENCFREIAWELRLIVGIGGHPRHRLTVISRSWLTTFGLPSVQDFSYLARQVIYPERLFDKICSRRQNT
jgi:hypothetical protein